MDLHPLQQPNLPAISLAVSCLLQLAHVHKRELALTARLQALATLHFLRTDLGERALSRPGLVILNMPR